MKHYPSLYCLWLIISSFIYFKANAQVNIKDSLALVDFYNSTGGQNWSKKANWLTANPINTWYGITVTGKRVTEINLSSNHLSDTLPASIGNLTELRYLNLFDNKSLITKIPNTIGKLTKLEYLDFSYCRIKESLPVSIGNLKALKYLLLYHTSLSGSIPSSIGNLINLTELSLGESKLTGAIPATIGNLKNLEYLDLERNKLSGTLPASIGDLVKLLRFSVNENRIQGTIPPSVSNMVSLEWLFLSSNKLTGNIPSSIGKMENLTDLVLTLNKLSGKIPASLTNLKNIKRIDFGQNELTGEIPPAIFKLETLRDLFLYNNNLTQNKNYNPDISLSPLLRVSISYNRYTFNGLEFFAEKLPSNTSYSPQAIIHVRRHGNNLAVSAGGRLSNNTYTWYKVGQSAGTTITGDSVFTPTQAGKYYVKVTNAVATKLTLASDTINFTMSIASNNSNLAVAGINNQKQIMQVSPNPVVNSVNIKLNGSAVITLTNEAGKTIITKTITNNTAINVKVLPNGTYYIKNTGNGEVQKIIVTH